MPTTPEQPLQQVLDALRSRDRFVVVSHARPDGDASGSQLALALALFGAGVLFRARLLAFLERFANVPAQSAQRGAEVAPEAPAGGEDARPN